MGRVEKDERRDEVKGVSRQQRDDDIPAPTKDRVRGRSFEALKDCAYRKVVFVKTSPMENFPPFASIASLAFTTL